MLIEERDARARGSLDAKDVPLHRQEGVQRHPCESSWRFRAGQPPGKHPYGAFFTPLPPGTPNLAKRLGIPKRKLKFVFAFTDAEDLKPLRGDRGKHVCYAGENYFVSEDRQQYSGKTEDYP